MTSSEDRMYGNTGNDGWGFDALDQTDETHGAGDSLLDAIDDDDTASNKAQYDRDNDSGFGDAMDFETNQNSPSGYVPSNEYEDDSNVFHVEHAAELPDLVETEDPPPADIHLSDFNMESLGDDEAVGAEAAGASPPPPSSQHGKMD